MKNLLLSAALCGLMLPAFAHTEKDGKECKVDPKTGQKSCCVMLSRGAMLKKGTTTAAKTTAKATGLQKTAVYSVTKMECEGCSGALQAGLAKEKGVSEAKVDYKAKRATLRFDAKQTDAKKLEAVFARKGFPAKLLKS